MEKEFMFSYEKDWEYLKELLFPELPDAAREAMLQYVITQAIIH